MHMQNSSFPPKVKEYVLKMCEITTMWMQTCFKMFS